ncbi:MAG: CRISPR-associated ring nuclease Csm6 [Blastocatellia bacterium]|nr:CRISPR-associated ring nuclease Csm6 [Blastocatellia bacterium]
MSKEKNILLCVAGMTPQIITETLYAVTQERGERVDEIRVVTTLDGRDKIMTGIANGRGRPEESLLHPEAGQFYAFCRDFKIDPDSIRFDEKSIALLQTRDGLTLPDIRTLEENELAGDRICDIVRELAKDENTRIHASAAGGRKTMSIYLTAAMQLFGRAQDMLSHVLVNEDFEGNPAFYYPPPEPIILRTRDGREVSTKDARIYLAPIPFIRLRGARSEWLREGERRYGDFVRQAQEYLDLADSVHDVNIHLRGKTLMIANRSVKLAEREFFIYSMFAYLRKQNRSADGFIAITDIRIEDIDATFRMITKARGSEAGIDDCASVPRMDFIQTLINGLNQHDNEIFKTTFQQVIAKIKKKFDDAGLPARYLFASDGERGALRFGLSIPPERLIWK